MTSIYIKNALSSNSEPLFVFIKHGVIQKISDHDFSNSLSHIDETINANKQYLLPGLIDMQVHFREPGFEYKEDIKSGARAAARGGFTTVACMPNTKPSIDSREVLVNVQKKIKESSDIEVLVIPAMTKSLQGKEIVNYEEYLDLNIIGVTDDGKGIQDDEMMMKVFQDSHKYGFSVLQHCEFDHISDGASLHEGSYTQKHNLKGIPSSSEFLMVKRDLELLEKTGGHYHVLHASAKETVELVREAKKKGLNITAEVTPHHLLLCDEDIPELNPNFKMNPPLRSAKDRQALVDGLIDGTIDMVSTDHAPHSRDEKSQSLEEAPFGVVGLETAFPLLYTKLVQTNLMSLEKLIEVMSLNPQKVFNITRGEIKVGARADLILVNTQASKEVSADEFESKSENSPFLGWKLSGWPVMTMYQGKVVYQEQI